MAHVLSGRRGLYAAISCVPGLILTVAERLAEHRVMEWGNEQIDRFAGPYVKPVLMFLWNNPLYLTLAPPLFYLLWVNRHIRKGAGAPTSLSSRYTKTAVSFLGFKRETESYEQYAEKAEALNKRIEEIAERDHLFLKGKATPWEESVIFESEPRQLAAEPHLAWWHVSVTSGADESRPCRVFLRLRDDGRDLPLVWATDDGPCETLVLRHSQGVYRVPVLARCVVDALLSGAPGKLRHFRLPAGVARLTDANAILRQTGFTDLPPGAHRFQVWAQEDGREPVASPEYIVTVPAPETGNGELVLARIDPEQQHALMPSLELP